MKKMRRFDPAGNPLGPYARYVRLPSRGREPHTGFSRGFLYKLFEKGAVRHAKVPCPGRNSGGVRVFWLEDAMSYIEKYLKGPGPIGVDGQSRRKG